MTYLGIGGPFPINPIPSPTASIDHRETFVDPPHDDLHAVPVLEPLGAFFVRQVVREVVEHPLSVPLPHLPQQHRHSDFPLRAEPMDALREPIPHLANLLPVRPTLPDLDLCHGFIEAVEGSLGVIRTF